MLKNYLKITLRNIKRNKAFSVINIAGLAIGMACCILIVNYIVFESSYDRFHKNADNIYRINTLLEIGGRGGNLASTNHPIGDYLRENYTEVLNSVKFRRYKYGQTLIEYEDNKFFEERLYYADNSVFDVFSYPMLIGDPKTALKSSHSIVLTESYAIKYFGEENPLGKILRLDNFEDFKVTGVIRDFPPNTHFPINMLLSFESFYVNNPQLKGRWMGDFEVHTFIQLEKGFDYKELETKLPAIVEKQIGKLIKVVGARVEYSILPLTDIHLHSDLLNEPTGQSDISYIYGFSAIALFILLIACFNFMNLSTARSAKRANEVGVRKVLGANKTKLVYQFLGESLILSTFAYFIAAGLAELSLPIIRSLTTVELSIFFTDIPLFILISVGFVFVVGIVAGSYPAFFLSSFKPVSILKGSLRTGSTSYRFRSVLVVFQFAISVFLFIGTITILNQIRFMKNRNLGFEREHLVFVQFFDDSLMSSTETVKNELLKIPGVIHASATSHIPGHGARHNGYVPEGFAIEESIMMGRISVDSDFITTFGIELIEGRNFSPEFTADKNQSILINETALKEIGWEDPLGRQIRELDDKMLPKTVIGVVRDFHTDSLHNPLEPVLIGQNPAAFKYIAVRLGPGNISETMTSLEKIWKELDSTGTFDYAFLEDSLIAQYRAEERLSKIFTYFSILAIFIACLGLFGLASFAAEQKTKEIGIRKVLGAPVSGLIFFLSKEFTKWVIVANLIGWPIAYFLMQKWLQNFAFRISIGIGIFLLAAILALLIALVTVSYQSLKAALANPIESLRYE
ncbi:MAG: ABC transporter permease [Candidatus Aminicenantes bacterium]|jgi:putative ABC transport system permease protein